MNLFIKRIGRRFHGTSLDSQRQAGNVMVYGMRNGVRSAAQKLSATMTESYLERKFSE